MKRSPLVAAALASAALIAISTSAVVALVPGQSTNEAPPKAEPKSAPNAAPTGSGAPEPAGALAPEDAQKAMAAWIESMKPTAEHAALANDAGTWDVAMTISGMPGSPPMESKLRSRSEVVLGGKYLAETMEGEMMGMPMQGRSLMTYDAIRKQYVLTWADNFSSSIMRMTGGASPDGTVLTFFGEMDEPMTGEIGKTVKLVRRTKDKDHFVTEMWEVVHGEPFKVWEAQYTRSK